jgi:di/tricarboxylate transporter
MGLEQIQLFDFVLPAVIAGSIGMMFLWLVAPRLLPNDPPRSTKESTRIFEAILNVNEGEFTEGKTLSEVQEKAGSNFKIDKIKRSDSLFVAKIPSVMFEAGDRIYVNDTLENLQEYQQLLGLSLFEEEVAEEVETEIGSEVQLAEVVITSGSFLDHTSLNAQHFSSRFNLLPIAVHSGSTGIELKGEIAAKTLTPGDVVLVQGSLEAIENLKTNSNMLVIENEDLDLGTKRSFVPLYIMVGVAGLAASNLLPISIAAMLGLIGMLVFRLMKWSDVGNAMNIPIIMLIVASLSLGNALEITGGSDYLAELFVYATSSMSVALILSTLMLLMAVLTNVVSNNAAAVIGTPIAINIAQQLGASPEPFVLAVLFGANMSFVTPIGYKTNLLIMGAGGYKFNDFVKVGLPLAFIMWVAFSIILPVLYL